MAVCNSHKHREHVGELALQDLQMNNTKWLAIPELLLLENNHLIYLVYSNQTQGLTIIWCHHKILIEDSHSNIDLILLMLEEVEWRNHEDMMVRYP